MPVIPHVPHEAQMCASWGTHLCFMKGGSVRHEAH